jgi:chaperonin GroEL
VNRRLANLGAGMTKIKIAASSITEYRTIRFKLDDAIGAVRCALKDGVVLGGGYALASTSVEVPLLREVLFAPMKTILSNAGYEFEVETLREGYGIDAKTGKKVDLYKTGIIDSYASIASALRNASSIACGYLRAYILINENVKSV